MASPAIGGFPSSSRSPFRVINPVTEEYHLGPDLNSTANKRGGKKPFSFFAISYVWSDWNDDDYATSQLPSWNLIRNRLLQLSTTNLVLTGTDATTPPSNEPFRCWIDCKCIDQSSAQDKAYWVPRMNRVFYSARCTILLLRDFDLTGIYELYRITQCRFGGTRTSPETTAQQQGYQQHRCLFDPSCITLRAPIPHTLESLCVETLKALWNGTWRKRAWIFQEILLSERYILSWGDAAVIAYIDLETIGYMAAFLQSRYPQESWLHDFWTWCKQCAYIRQFYSENCDMEATILQLAEDLESTLPCDKYYALCGILGLDNIQYNPSHSAGEALDNIVSALTRLGRMGWMYAIPPSVNEGVVLSPHDMAPFVLTRKKKQQPKQQPIDIREPFFTSQLFGVMTLEMGSVNNEETFDQVLRQMHGLEDSMSQLGRNPERRPNFIKDCYMTSSYVHRQFPTILFRLGYDSIGPLCDPKLLRVLFHTLDWGGFNEALFPTNRECCFWFVVVRLCFITPGEINYIAEPDKREVVRISAQHMQRLCQKLHMQNWKVLQWQKPPEDLPKSASQPAEPRLAVFNGTLPTFGKTVWSVQTKLSSTSLMFIAGEMQPVAPAPYEYPDGSGAVSPISLSSLDKPGMDLTLRNLKVFRTELSDTSMCFYGVVYQVAQNSPYSTETYKAAFHDSPNEQEEPDDLINRLKRFRIKGSSSSSNLRMSSSQEKRVKFLTFQRKDAQGQPPRPFSPYGQQYYNVHSPVQNFHQPGYPTPNPPLSYSQVPPPRRAAPDTPQSSTNPYRPPSNAPLMTSALSYLERDVFAYEPPQQQYYPQQNLSPPYDRPREAPCYEPSDLSPYGLQELPADLPPAELDSMPMRQPLVEMGPTPVRQSIAEPLQEPIITTTTTRRDPFVSEFFQEMPTTSELKEMFPLLTEYAIMGIRARHGSNIQAVMDECLNSVASLAIADPEPARVSRKSSLDASQWDHVFRAMEAQTEAMRNQQAERRGKEKEVSVAADSNEAQSSGDAYEQSLAIDGDHRWDRTNVLVTEDKRSLQSTLEVITDRLPEYVHQTEDGQERSASFISPEKTETEVPSRTEIPHRVGVHSTDSCTPPSLHPIDIPPDDDFTLSQRIASIRRPSGELPSPPTASKAVTRTPEPFMANSVITEALLATKTPNPSTKIGQQPASSLLQAPLTPKIISSTVKATQKGNGTAPGPPLASRSAHVSKPKPAVPPKPKSLKVNAHTRSLSHQLTGSRTLTIALTSTTQSIPNTPTMQAEKEAVFSSSPSRAPRLEGQLAPRLEPMQAIQPSLPVDDAPPKNAPPTETTSSESPTRERTLKREDSYDTLYDAPKDYTAKKKAEKEEKDKQADAWLIDFSDDMSAQVVKLERSENNRDYSVDLLSLLDEPIPLI